MNMALLETNPQVLSNIVKHEYPYKHLSRETVKLTVAEGDCLQVGQVVGQVTADKTFKLAKETAVDGTKAFYGVIVALPEGAINSWMASKAGDINVVVLSKAPAMINPEGLILDSTYDDTTKKNALYATIVAKGIDLAEVK